MNGLDRAVKVVWLIIGSLALLGLLALTIGITVNLMHTVPAPSQLETPTTLYDPGVSP